VGGAIDGVGADGEVVSSLADKFTLAAQLMGPGADPELTEQQLLDILQPLHADAAASAQVPSALLPGMAQKIELISGRKAPRLLQQKRTYVADWVNEMQKKRERQRQLAESPLGATMRACRLDNRSMLMHEDGSAHDQVLALLGKYAEGPAPSAAGGGVRALRVPVEHVSILTQQLEAITGTRAPKHEHARRALLDKAFADAVRKAEATAESKDGSTAESKDGSTAASSAAS